MRVENTEKQSILTNKLQKSVVSGATDFANILSTQKHSGVGLSQKSDLLAANQASLSLESSNINLGILSGKNKSVAQLLLANPTLKSKTWSIIHNSINQNKAFKQITAGKTIYFNPKTQELSWSESKHDRLGKPVHNADNNPLSAISYLPDSNPVISSESEKIIIIGQINQSNPTISDLLSQQSDLKAKRWSIIHSELNKNKEYTKIPNGTTIYIDKKSNELSWKTPDNSLQTITSMADKTNDNSTSSHTINKRILASKLDDAVKPFIGTEYKHLDCYTLVVNGLENMGIRYRGKGNLGSQLLHRAQLDGRARNAYLTGEGLTEALGDKIYTKAITRIKNIDQQSQAVFQEMQNLMKKGDILSFSLQSKGHTGIISQNNKQWTYINSGRMDHSITSNAPRHGVGEESLLSEISNWIKLAQKRQEALQITVGRLDRQKIAQAPESSNKPLA